MNSEVINEKEQKEEEISQPVHRILIVKQKATNVFQLLVQSSESLKACKKVFDEIIEKHEK